MAPSQNRGPIQDLSRNELEVLKPLWASRRLSAREVHDAISPALGWAYTTTRTMLDRLVAKGHISRQNLHGIHVYEARVTRVRALAGLVRDFARSVLEVDPRLVVPLFTRAETLTDQEIAELEDLLEEIE